MDDEMVDLGQGAMIISGIDTDVDLSNLDAIIAQAELSDVETVEIDITR
jgi:hypothetical protein